MTDSHQSRPQTAEPECAAGAKSFPRLPKATAIISSLRRRSAATSLALLLGLAVTGRALAQAIPTATADPISTGFQLPTALGSMTYSVSGSEMITSGYTSGTGWQPATGLSGNLALISSSHYYPTSLVFSGGRFFSTSNQPSTTYLDLAISQVASTKNWNFVLTDSLAYLPATASVGLGGVPGAGDLGVPPIQIGIDPGQGILTNYSKRISNAVSLNATRRITGKVSLQTSGIYSMLRFLDAPAGQSYNSNTYSASVGISRQINPLTILSVNYSYGRYTFMQGLPGFKTQTVSADYNRKLSRRLSLDVQAGPQFTSGAFSTTATGGSQQSSANTPVTTTTNAFISANLSYSTRFANYALGYSRGTNAGYGVTEGSRSDSVRFSGSKIIARVWGVSASTGYSRSTTLGLAAQPVLSPETFIVSAQASRALAHNLSTYASYTLEKQNGTGNGLLFNVFSGSFQVVAFGLTYSPPALRFGNR